MRRLLIAKCKKHHSKEQSAPLLMIMCPYTHGILHTGLTLWSPGVYIQCCLLARLAHVSCQPPTSHMKTHNSATTVPCCDQF